MDGFLVLHQPLMAHQWRYDIICCQSVSDTVIWNVVVVWWLLFFTLGFSLDLILSLSLSSLSLCDCACWCGCHSYKSLCKPAIHHLISLLPLIHRSSWHSSSDCFHLSFGVHVWPSSSSVLEYMSSMKPMFLLLPKISSPPLPCVAEPQLPLWYHLTSQEQQPTPLKTDNPKILLIHLNSGRNKPLNFSLWPAFCFLGPNKQTFNSP